MVGENTVFQELIGDDGKRDLSIGTVGIEVGRERNHYIGEEDYKEGRWAKRLLKNGKAMGIDGVVSEMMKSWVKLVCWVDLESVYVSMEKWLCAWWLDEDSDCSVYKGKGNKSQFKNYRGIILSA